jgi:hypothetical protein
MRIFTYFILTLFSFLAISCQQPNGKRQPINWNDSLAKKQDKAVSENTLPAETKEYQCTRGQATPIIDKSVYPNTTFQIQADSITAIETVVFENGDKLVIHNWGCDYFVVTFRFETSRFIEDTTDLEAWFKHANTLTASVLSALNVPIEIERGLVYLNSYMDWDENNGHQNLQLGKQLDFGGSDMRSFLTIDRIEKLSDNRTAVEISFSEGPL